MTYKRPRKICFISERRADYSRLKPIMSAIRANHAFDPQLVVTGSHLLKDFGRTENLIRQDGFQINATLPIFSTYDPDNGASMTKAMGKALIGFSKIFQKLRPDLIFTGFDLGANLAAAIAGMHMNIHVSHIQGGEVTGTIDEVLRHAMTKFAHIHFAATEQSRQRIIRLGEDPNYVFWVGSPSLDTIHSLNFSAKIKIFLRYGLDAKKPLIIFLQHPVTTEVTNVQSQIRTSIEAVKRASRKNNAQILAIYSNNDAGGKRIITMLKKSELKIFAHIPYEDFLNLMKYAHAIVGNSSAAIHEAPSFGLPAVNIGTRQQNRERGVNVQDVPHEISSIERAIKKALYDKKYRAKVKNGKNPYDRGNAAKRIVKILKTIKLPPLQKKITY